MATQQGFCNATIFLIILTLISCFGAAYARKLTEEQELQAEVKGGTDMAVFLEKTFTDAKEEAKKMKLADSVKIGSKTLQLPSVYFSKTPAGDSSKPSIQKSVQQGDWQINGKVRVDMELTFVAMMDNAQVVLGSGGAFVRMKCSYAAGTFAENLHTHDFELLFKSDFAWSPEAKNLKPSDSNENSLAYKLLVLIEQDVYRRLKAAARCGNIPKPKA